MVFLRSFASTGVAIFAGEKCEGQKRDAWCGMREEEKEDAVDEKLYYEAVSILPAKRQSLKRP